MTDTIQPLATGHPDATTGTSVTPPLYVASDGKTYMPGAIMPAGVRAIGLAGSSLGPAPMPVPTFSCVQLGGTPAMVEMTVRVELGARYYVSTWNEVETPEIARVFAEMQAAEAALLKTL